MQTASIKKLLVVFLCIIALTVGADRLGMLRGTEQIITRIVTPILTITFQSAQAVRSFAETALRTPSSLRTENASLKQQLVAFDVLQAKALQLQQENESLTNLLHYTPPARNKITAHIAGSGTDGTVQSMIIDRGATDGIHTGDPVVAEEGILIGTVINLKEHTALVQLITDNQSRIGVGILNKEGTIGIASGSHGLSTQIEMIPQNETVTQGDKVITSGIEDAIPRGLLLGQILSVKKEASEPFQTAHLALPIDFNKLTWVSVLTH